MRLVDWGQFDLVAPAHDEVGIVEEHLAIGLEDWHGTWVALRCLAIECLLVKYSSLIAACLASMSSLLLLLDWNLLLEHEGGVLIRAAVVGLSIVSVRCE